MDVSELKQQWLAEERAAFAGWDFSRIHARTSEDALPWDYRELIRAHLRPAHRLLDLGTGGGEFLLSLSHPYENTCVTEGWEPNVRLCRERLAPLGIGVYEADGGDRLPFADNAFDIVINRHESYDFGEAARVLKPGVLFTTRLRRRAQNAPRPALSFCIKTRPFRICAFMTSGRLCISRKSSSGNSPAFRSRAAMRRCARCSGSLRGGEPSRAPRIALCCPRGKKRQNARKANVAAAFPSGNRHGDALF